MDNLHFCKSLTIKQLLYSAPNDSDAFNKLTTTGNTQTKEAISLNCTLLK